MDPTPGTMVTNNLRLKRLLGAGGMGSVWIADHLGLETEVAVKFISTELAKQHPQLVTRFKREAGVAAKIKSPHVVQVFDHGLTPDGTPYIAMELLEGESLEDRLARTGCLTVGETALVLSQTAQVLDKAHELGIVHRDIKPANLFLIDSAYDMFVKVLDFGIAKNVDAMKEVSVTSTGSMMGSPLYMSPEQFTSAKGVDGRADLWSLSVVAYHALTGMPAFGGETLGQVMMAVMKAEYAPVLTIRGDLPQPLDDFFARAFAEKIEQRFQSADELARAFSAIASGDPDASQRLSVSAPLPNTMVQAPVNAVTGVGSQTLEPAASTLGSTPARKTPWPVYALAVAAVVAVAVAALTLTRSDGTAAQTSTTAAADATGSPAAAAPTATSQAAATSASTVSAETTTGSAATSSSSAPPPPPAVATGPRVAPPPKAAPTPTATKTTPQPTPGGDEKYGF